MNKSLFEKICSLENIFAAWAKFSDGKRSKADVMAFELHLEDNLFALREMLISGEYRHDPYEPFTVHDPKQRRIHKATVKDRIVHQAIVNVIEPFFERRFIHDSYSCRVGKGTHAAVDRLRAFLCRASCNNTRTVYALKCDVRKFFASVDQCTLFSLLKRHIVEDQTMELILNILESFSVSERRGIPLGNLTSQLFANVYLHELDWHVKHELRIRYYVRYCDDFVILTPSRTEALNLVERIDTFLKSRLKLQLHPNKVTIRTWEQGVDFVGYVLLPNATAIRMKTTKRMLMRVTQDNLSSYSGVCRHATAYDLERIVQNVAWGRSLNSI